MWPFALTACTVAIYFRFYGIIYDRTIDCGEIRSVNNNVDHPAVVCYNVGELSG